MSSDASHDAPAMGRRLKRRILLALCLFGALPALLLVWLVYRFAFHGVGPRGLDLLGLEGLVLLVLLALMIRGAWMIWDLGRAVSRMAELLSQQPNVATLGARTDEIGALMKSFVNMIATIDQQALEINTYGTRLDAAYKELQTASAALRETSFRDEVTGLYNRRFFFLRLEEEIARFRRFNHPVSVVLLDLDGFKAINDEFGHVVGDATLREIAQVLTKHSRGINVLSRYGGDEFAILLVETPKAGAYLYADRIRQVLAASLFAQGKRVTASLGVASLPDDEAATAEDLFRAADEALYTAKRAGKNQVAGAGRAERVP